MALSNLYDLNETTYQETEILFNRAVKLSPNSSWFYSFWSLWKMFCLGQNWAKDLKSELAEAGMLARQAIKRDSEDALALAILGHFESFWHKNVQQGKKYLDNSLHLNKYSSFAWMLSSATYSYLGEPQEALHRLEKSKFLCPVEPHFEFLFATATCVAHLINRDPQQAVDWGMSIVQDNPGFTNGYKHLLVALGHLGRVDECQHHLSILLDLDPRFTAKVFIDSYPFQRPDDKNYFQEGLYKAGVPPGTNGTKSRLSIVE